MCIKYNFPRNSYGRCLNRRPSNCDNYNLRAKNDEWKPYMGRSNALKNINGCLNINLELKLSKHNIREYYSLKNGFDLSQDLSKFGKRLKIMRLFKGLFKVHGDPDKKK